jgi:hypothetical protein
MQVLLDNESHSLKIKQQITYHNNSKDTLKIIYFHDWANAYVDKNTHLGKRFLENYSKRFFFTKDKNRGFTKINNIVANYESIQWERDKKTDDYFKILLNKPLKPKDSISIDFNYTVKIPNAKFTGYGVRKGVYNLRYWYLVPAVYNGKWHLMHNLDMDDLYQNLSDYSIRIKIPKNYYIHSNLLIRKDKNGKLILSGKNTKDIELILTPNSDFKKFRTDEVLVETNLNTIELGDAVKKDILNRQLIFLKEKLGGLQQNKILINKTGYFKNPLYGFNQLPNFLRPFSDTFEWDLRMFKILSNKYIDKISNADTRNNIWLTNGIQTYLMIQYIEKYYHKTKLIGNASKIWGVRSYHLSKLNFNDRYAVTYQYFASKNRDQSLLTQTDSLTNFNRLILNKYKSGIGLNYLGDYLGDSIVQGGIKASFSNPDKKQCITENFKRYIVSHTDKDVNWFFEDFIKTNNKFDYSLKKSRIRGDSLLLIIKNKRHSPWPVALYNIKDDSIISKKWLQNVDSTKVVRVSNDKDTRWFLNYENKTPEINLRNNWQNSRRSLFKRPLSIKWLNDADDPEHAQLFFEPKFNYNYYDGFMLASSFTNRSLLKKEFEYTLTPAYGFKSNSLTGSFKTIYWRYPNNTIINSYRIGLVGSYFHYKPNLSYRTLAPYAQLFFKKKDLRSVKGSSASMSYIMVNREVDPLFESQESDKYNVLNLRYVYSNPELINNFLFMSNLEVGTNFSKLSTDIRFRKLTNSNRQFEVRLFTGLFLHNTTTSDFFSFGINRPNDYLFRYRYYGRSETSGIFSQQFMITDASIKSEMPVKFANQWVSSLNTSIGLWRWFEIYSDVGFAKNREQSVFFIHDKGVRLNFVHNIFEVYFPVHSNNGWEISQPHYEERIRFVLTSDIQSIIGFLKRGFM